MTGVNSMNGRISFSISIPGAISISVRRLAGKFEYRTFRNIENVLVSLFDGIFTGECDMFDILFEFDIFAFPDYIDAAVFNIYLAFSSCERAKEAYRLGALGYIY